MAEAPYSKAVVMGDVLYISGQLGRDADGNLTHYWVSALVGGGASLLSFVLSSRLRLHGASTN